MSDCAHLHSRNCLQNLNFTKGLSPRLTANVSGYYRVLTRKARLFLTATVVTKVTLEDFNYNQLGGGGFV